VIIKFTALYSKWFVAYIKPEAEYYAMQHRIHVNKLFVGSLAALLLAGCATHSTVQSRKQERYAAYQALPADQKAAVDQGRLMPGMSMDAVYIAWGKPTQVISGGGPGGETVTWLYQHNYLQETEYLGTRHVYYGYTPSSYVGAQVVFVNGVVSTWQTFASPMAR